MATMEFIQKRISGKEKEIDKLTKKLARIRKAEAGGWDRNNPYLYSESDLRRCLKDLEAAREALAKYQSELQTASEKAASRNVTVILEFLDGWKARSRKFYADSFERYVKAKAEYQEKEAAHTEWFNRARMNDPDRKSKEDEYLAYRKQFNEAWAFLTPYLTRQANTETHRYEVVLAVEKLNKDLDTEANRKYDFIIERTNAIVGEITDASGLSVGAKGDLNGYIIGLNGRAKVQTIGAGGYNIQCFHFRTLINAA